MSRIAVDEQPSLENRSKARKCVLVMGGGGGGHLKITILQKSHRASTNT